MKQPFGTDFKGRAAAQDATAAQDAASATGTLGSLHHCAWSQRPHWVQLESILSDETLVKTDLRKFALAQYVPEVQPSRSHTCWGPPLAEPGRLI